LQDQSWPDNVRELRQVVECALVLGHNKLHLDRCAVASALELVCAHQPRGRAKDNEERSKLMETLERCGWRIGDAAAHLGVHRTTLFRRMRRLEIAVRHTRRSFDAESDMHPAMPYGGPVMPTEVALRTHG
jgi:transcriptional regulator of acetoin/glycerol metabolism